MITQARRLYAIYRNNKADFGTKFTSFEAIKPQFRKMNMGVGKKHGLDTMCSKKGSHHFYQNTLSSLCSAYTHRNQYHDNGCASEGLLYEFYTEAQDLFIGEAYGAEFRLKSPLILLGSKNGQRRFLVKNTILKTRQLPEFIHSGGLKTSYAQKKLCQ
ncbi:uncharacterized protein [Struthio camelus]|uniref:uncharacterized protein isoform X3 n=1 Tax=Struthio camelus TaxID=8801 RepID=UPI003603E93C